MKKMLLWLNIGLIFISLGAYISPHVSAADYWVFSVLGLFYPWILLANFLCIFFWVITKKWYFIYSLLWLIIGWGHFSSVIAFNSQASILKKENQIKLITYNCRGFSKDVKSKVKWSAKEVTHFIKQHQPDVIAFQEFPMGTAAKKYADILHNNTNLKYHFYKKNGQLALFSAYPIAKKNIHYFTNRSNGYLCADIKKGDQIFRIFNVHLQSNVVTSMADKVKSEGKLQEKETWLSIKGMIRKYKRAAAVRSTQAKEIAVQIKKSPHPVVLCGDFNDVPQSNAYHILVKNKQDAFKMSGSGLGTTYAGSIPALRIDYILSNRRFEVLKQEIIKFSYSDHYPVAVYLSLINE